MIYFIQPTDGGPVKIGTTTNLDLRLEQLEKHYGCALAALATMDGGPADEREIHARFAHLRYGHTEQFQPASDLMEFISRPLLVVANPEAVEAIEPQRASIIQLKGTPEYARWLDDLHRATHIPKATLFRIALAEWATNRSHPEPPER